MSPDAAHRVHHRAGAEEQAGLEERVRDQVEDARRRSSPVPTPANMKPSWLTVEYASTFLKSFWAKPMIAANSAVAAPTIATIASAAGVSA